VARSGGADLLEDGQLVAHPPVLGQPVALAPVQVHGRHGVGPAGGGDAQVVGVVDEKPEDGQVAVGPGRDQSGRGAVVDEVGRDQLADAFGPPVVQGLVKP
jgi:hypothetical protein